MRTVTVFILVFCIDFAVNAEEKKAGERLLLKAGNAELAFRWCPPGTFQMGSPKAEQQEAIRQTEAWIIEKIAKAEQDKYKKDRTSRILSEIQHTVRLTAGFYLQETEVTQEQWDAVQKNLKQLSIPVALQDARYPVMMVSWAECVHCVKKLNALDIAPQGFKFALPTEAQWEYACRAGTTSAFNFGDSMNGTRANCNGRYPFGTTRKGPFPNSPTKAGSFPANAWGLFDMHGNVWEWCSDWYGAYDTGADVVSDPKGPNTGEFRVTRGGSWQDRASGCRSAYRSSILPPTSELTRIGFRLALVP